METTPCPQCRAAVRRRPGCSIPPHLDPSTGERCYTPTCQCEKIGADNRRLKRIVKRQGERLAALRKRIKTLLEASYLD